MSELAQLTISKHPLCAAVSVNVGYRGPDIKDVSSRRGRVNVIVEGCILLQPTS